MFPSIKVESRREIGKFLKMAEVGTLMITSGFIPVLRGQTHGILDSLVIINLTHRMRDHDNALFTVHRSESECVNLPLRATVMSVLKNQRRDYRHVFDSTVQYKA